MRTFFALTATLLSLCQPAFAEFFERVRTETTSYEGPGMTFEYGNTKVTIKKNKDSLELYDAYTKAFIDEVKAPAEWPAKEVWYSQPTININEEGVRYWGMWGGRLGATKNDKVLWFIDLNYRDTQGTIFPNSAKATGITEINDEQLVVAFTSSNTYPSVNTAIVQKSTGHIMGHLAPASDVQKDENFFYLRHDFTVAAYDRKTLAKVWETAKLNSDQHTSNNLVLDGDYLFTATQTQDNQNFLHALDKKTGKSVGQPQKLEEIVWGLLHDTSRRRFPNSVSVYTQNHEGCNGYYCTDDSRWIYTFSVEKEK